ncbi:3659_t:CDS:1, partial [Dentiscutata erythropus]
KIISISFLQLSTASIIDYSYSSQQDLYDAILNSLFPIFFVLLFNVRGESGRIKKVALPLIDDILYNLITWTIPLIVAFTYGDTLPIKVFSIINMCLHVFFAVYAIIKHETIKGSKAKPYTEIIFWFLVFFPVIVIPAFWISVIINERPLDSINLTFLILFGLLLVSAILILILLICYIYDLLDLFALIFLYIPNFLEIFFSISFYTPNILQTFFILLKWPINFYFVKTCVFILILSLTRNSSYFTDSVPDDFLATSTAITQLMLRNVLSTENYMKTEESSS